MRPPVGYLVDCAVGTTFSLDLLTALTIPLGFAVHDWTDDNGAALDPLAALEAIRRYSEKLTIFCEAGQIKLPREYRTLITWLEPALSEVQPRDEKGVFHPKVWVLRFVNETGPILYRVLCLSRNLTFDRCWDVATTMDGELIDRDLGIRDNHPLADFVAALPKMALRSLDEERLKHIRQMADELRRVRFVLPEGIDDYRFWHGGLPESSPEKCWGRVDQALLIAPFVSDDVVLSLSTQVSTYLVSRPESLRMLELETLRSCRKVWALDPGASQPEQLEEALEGQPPTFEHEVLSGLHAKLFIIDRGWNASVFTGSFNATHHAFYHNVEFMVELIGRKRQFGVDEFLRRTETEMKFVNMLTEYPLGEASKCDQADKDFDEAFRLTKRAIIGSSPELKVSNSPAPGLFAASLVFAVPPVFKSEVSVRCWPISLQAQSAQPIASAAFDHLSYEKLTPLIAYAVTAKIGQARREAVFVASATLVGAPTDREQRVLAALLANKDNFLRYLLLLLAGSDAGADSTAEALHYLRETTRAQASGARPPSLFETLMRALYRQPAQLDRINQLIVDLKTTGQGSELLTEEFMSVWEPIWQVRKAKEKSS
jgi:hypothetical protein